ncbi:MAG: hypothetical protein KHY39_07060 [Clostridiaceae bacterium]|nr:hypothetical protein [Clostridiaceae bacterium]
MQKEKEKRNPGYITWLNRLAVAATIAAIAEAVHIMKNGFGLLEQLDFGAGAYYYADIPGFASLVNGSHYQSPVSMPVLIALFLIWGVLMYRLWSWMESGTKKESVRS